MSILTRRSRPFCNARNGYGFATPQQGTGTEFDPGITQGTEWDGAGYYPDLPIYPLGIFGYIPSYLTHGSGTAYPIELTFEQAQRWHWDLDEWKFRASFEFGAIIGDFGADDGPFTTFTLDYDDFPDGGTADPTMPMRRRIAGRTVVIEKIKDVGGGTLLTVTLTMGGMMVDPAFPGVYFPYVTFDLADPTSGTPHWQRDSSLASFSWSLPGGGQPDEASISTPTGGTFDIDDGTGTIFHVPIWRTPPLGTTHAPPDGSQQCVRFLSGDAKPTGYLAV